MNPGARATQLMRLGLVWDNHGCLPLRGDDAFLPQLKRYRDAGVDVVSINAGFAEVPWTEHLRMLSYMRAWIAQQQWLQLIGSVPDIAECKAAGRLGVVFDIEGMYPVVNDLSLVQTFYELGVRWMLIAYNRNNPAGGGCLDEDGGLTDLGRRVIDEMQRVGMVLCLSHTGARTAADALEYARAPVIFSHSNPAGHTPHARNVADTLLRACARTGGVIGLSGIGLYLGTESDLVSRLLDHIRYVVDLVGAEHVGLGLDFVFDRSALEEDVKAHPHLYPAGLSGSLAMIEPEAMGEIAEGLTKDNFTDEQIKGILGENWLRVARQVWR